MGIRYPGKSQNKLAGFFLAQWATQKPLPLIMNCNHVFMPLKNIYFDRD